MAISVDQSTDNKKYVSNVSNMRNRIKNISVNGVTAITNREFLPLWMRTPQLGSLNELGFVLALPLIYTKPGYSETIKQNLVNSQFDFKSIDYEIDRYIIENTKDNENEQFILFGNYQYNI